MTQTLVLRDVYIIAGVNEMFSCSYLLHTVQVYRPRVNATVEVKNSVCAFRLPDWLIVGAVEVGTREV